MLLKIISSKFQFKKVFILLAILVLFFESNGCFAGKKEIDVRAYNDSPLMWAGFAMAGDELTIGKLYPYSHLIFEEEKNNDKGSLDAILREKIQARPSVMNRLKPFNFQSDGKEDISSLAFVLAQETVEKQVVNNNINVLLTLQANVFVFNDKSHMVVANFPVRLGFLKSFNTEPTNENIKEMVHEMYTSSDKAGNIFDAWLDALEKARVREGKQKYLQVTDISVLPEAVETISESGVDEKYFQGQLAKILEAAISSKAGIPIVPSAEKLGEVGGKIKAKFANQSYELKLPEPDYALSFAVRGFVKKQAETDSTIKTGYRVKATISLKTVEPGGEGRKILDEGVYATDSTDFLKSANIKVNDWNQYFKLLQFLINQLGTELAEPKDAWLVEYATRDKEAKKGFVEANYLLKGL